MHLIILKETIVKVNGPEDVEAALSNKGDETIVGYQLVEEKPDESGHYPDVASGLYVSKDYLAAFRKGPDVTD